MNHYSEKKKFKNSTYIRKDLIVHLLEFINRLLTFALMVDM